MIFKCSGAELNDALSIASHALSARSTIPILEGVLLETGEDELRITCSDGAMTIVTTLPAQILQYGRAVLTGRLFNEVVRRLPNGEVSGELTEKLSLILRAYGSRTTLPAKPADQYPQLPEFDAKSVVSLPQPILRDMIQKTSFAVSAEETRRILMGALIEIKKGSACMVALDGFRMALRRSLLPPETPDLKAVVEGKILDEIAKIIGGGDEDFVTLHFGQSQLMVVTERATLYAPLLEGEFINYTAIIPASFATTATLKRQQLAECVDRASLIARESKTNLLRFEISETGIVITANTPIGDVYEELEAEVTGGSLEIAFNTKYLGDMLRAIEDESVVFCFNSSVSPCVVRPAEGDAYEYVILPVRLHA